MSQAARLAEHDDTLKLRERAYASFTRRLLAREAQRGADRQARRRLLRSEIAGLERRKKALVDALRSLSSLASSSVEDFHGAELVASAVDGDTTFSEWMWDVTLKGVGRIRMEQVARRRWKDGKIVHERFYYTKG